MQTIQHTRLQGRILGLDLLRLCAAVLVVLDHFGGFGLHQPSTIGKHDIHAFPFLSPMTSIGSIGVEIFFLISGFVITASAVHSTANRFAVNRFVRVAPALWISCLLALAARITTGEPLGGLLLATAKSAVLSPVGPYIDGVVWTLVVEAVFYVLIYTVIRFSHAARMDRAAVWLGAASGVYLIIFFAASLLAVHSPRFEQIFAVLGRFPFKVLLLRDGVFFATGMLMWSSLSRDGPSPHRGIIAVLIVLCLLEINIDCDSLINYAFRMGLWLLSLGALIVSALKADRIAQLAGGASAVFRFCGDLSYPIYLNHYTLGMVLVFEIGRLNLGMATTLTIALSVVFSVSAVIVIGPEKSVKRWMRARLGLFNRSNAAVAEPEHSS